MKALLKSIIYRTMSPFMKRKMLDNSVYLTYDDGPHPDNTESILSILKESQVKATFFMLGYAMDKYPHLVEQVIEQGHTLGYHSYKHISLKKRSFTEVKEDLQQMERLSKRYNYPIKLYRPPFGDLTATSFLWFILKGKKIVMWSLDSRDSFDPFEQVKKNVAPQELSNGEIILFHDDYEQAAELLKITLNAYRQHGTNCNPL